MKHANTDVSPPKPTAWRVSAGLIAIVATTGALSLLMAGGILVALTLPFIQANREAARREEARKNLENLSHAIHTHDAENRTAVVPSEPPPVHLGR